MTPIKDTVPGGPWLLELCLLDVTVHGSPHIALWPQAGECGWCSGPCAGAFVLL